MNLLRPRVEFWGETPLTAEGTHLWIERAARVCYNSEEKTKLGSAKPFIERILKPKPAHSSVLEHSSIILRSEKVKHPQGTLETIRGTIDSDFIFCAVYKGRVYIYGNYRAFMEYLGINFFRLPDEVPHFFPGYTLVTNSKDIPQFTPGYNLLPNADNSDNLPDDLLDLRALTACFYTDRAVSHEIVRHRAKTAFSQRSQRYCNESNLQIVEPYWFSNATPEAQKRFMLFCFSVEDTYRFLKEHDHNNQEARIVLPNSTSTILVVTAYMSAWKHFFNLRISSAAYPGIRHLMESVQTQMRNAGYIKEIT